MEPSKLASASNTRGLGVATLGELGGYALALTFLAAPLWVIFLPVAFGSGARAVATVAVGADVVTTVAIVAPEWVAMIVLVIVVVYLVRRWRRRRDRRARPEVVRPSVAEFSSTPADGLVSLELVHLYFL